MLHFPNPATFRNGCEDFHTSDQAQISSNLDCHVQSLIVLAKQIAERIRGRVDTYTEAFPAVLEIPSKDHPYDPEKDSVLRRVRRLFGD